MSEPAAWHSPTLTQTTPHLSLNSCCVFVLVLCMCEGLLVDEQAQVQWWKTHSDPLLK